MLVGSHLDTVRGGGLLDGAYGVLAGIAGVRELLGRDPVAAGRVVVAGFCNEEGAFGTAGMTGSRALVGPVDPDELARRDEEGVALARRLDAVAAPGTSVEAATWPRDSIAAYLELHVEQGPALEVAGARLGVVTSITGRVSLELDVEGAAAHAGTVPMESRHDALAAAAEAVLLVEEVAASGRSRTATVGDVSVGRGTMRRRSRTAPRWQCCSCRAAAVSATVRTRTPRRADLVLGAEVLADALQEAARAVPAEH